MYYYKIYNEEDKFLGITTSLDARYYNEKNKRMLCCLEDKAQYLCLNDTYYRPGVFNTENVEMQGRYENVSVSLTTEEEYLKYRAEIEKKNLE